MSSSRALRLGGALSALALTLSACATPVAGPGGNYSRPIGSALCGGATPLREAIAAYEVRTRSQTAAPPPLPFPAAHPR